jgi:hypothetical protein
MRMDHNESLLPWMREEYGRWRKWEGEEINQDRKIRSADLIRVEKGLHQ